MKTIQLIKDWNAKSKAERMGKDIPIDCLVNLCEAGEVRIADCSGKYRFKRLNEFGDIILEWENIDGAYEAIGTVYPARKGSVRIATYKAGITYDKIVKFSKIERVNK